MVLSNVQEPEVDMLRQQKDEELERYRWSSPLLNII
jgi:hypothetical protein